MTSRSVSPLREHGAWSSFKGLLRRARRLAHHRRNPHHWSLRERAVAATLPLADQFLPNRFLVVEMDVLQLAAEGEGSVLDSFSADI